MRSTYGEVPLQRLPCRQTVSALMGGSLIELTCGRSQLCLVAATHRELRLDLRREHLLRLGPNVSTEPPPLVVELGLNPVHCPKTLLGIVR